MTARVFDFDSDAHRSAQALLPWFVSGTLGEAERDAVARHVAACPQCQSDVADIERTRALRVGATTKPQVERGWSALLRRISSATAPADRHARIGRSVSVRALHAALLLQAAVILVLAAVLLWGARRDEPYRALGNGSTAVEANALVVFRSDATQAQIAAALRAVDARIVGGPTASDAAYLLLVAHAGPDSVPRLRAQAGVLSASSLDRAEAR